MPTPQTIIAATDFSASSLIAVKQAAFLSRLWNAKLILVHVYNDSVWASLKAVYSLPSWQTEQPMAAARRQLDHLGHEMASAFGIAVESELLIGRASRQIGDIVAARQAGLLVVGEHGENWVRDVVLGGTALKVLEATRIPVLLVRRAEAAAYRDILIATDFSPASERATSMALDCFPDAQMALIHAWLVPFEASMRMGGAREEDIEHYRSREFEDATRQLKEFTQRCSSENAADRLEQIAMHGAPASVLFDQARARGSDLIVIGKHSGRELDERLLGSVTQNILYHAECDVLLGV